MLRNVEILQFKSIKNLKLMDLPPIVGIWGKNGTGKSSLLQAIVWAAKNNGKFNQNGLNLGSPNDFIFKHEMGNNCIVNVTNTPSDEYICSVKVGQGVSIPNKSLKNIHYYPPWRSIMSRESPINARIESDLGFQGSLTHTFLHWFLHELMGKDMRDDKDARNIYKKVNYWSEKIGFGQILDSIRPNQSVSGTYKDSTLDVEIPIIDGGFGGNSFLPILLECYNEKDGIFLIEEPEISLHPGAQGDIWEFMMEMVKERGHQIIFTSHSPYLATKIARTLSEGKFQDKVHVYFTTKPDSNGTKFDLIPSEKMVERFRNYWEDIFPEMRGR